MLEIFSYDFMIRAFLIGMSCSILTAVLGNFLVASRQSVLSDMLSHSSLAGVGIGIFFHISPSLVALVVAIFSSLVLFFLTQKKTLPQEAVSILLLSGGIALALLFVHIAKNPSASLESFLFGSLLTVSENEMYGFFVLSLLIFFIFLFWYNRFLCVVLDKEFYESRFSSSQKIEILFFIIIGMLIAFSLKIIGGLLITSLLVISVLSAQYRAKSFRSSLLWSIIINFLSVVLGLFASFYFDIPTSSAIVISLIGFFVLMNMIKK